MAGMTYEAVGALTPGRSVFDLSYEKKFTCDMGELIPIMCDEVVPGDHFTIGNEIVVRFQPLVAPVLHEINCFVHYFFVPYRLLWPKVDDSGDDWESFITGGVDGLNAAVLPTWDPGAGGQAKGSLWDYLGLPIGIRPADRYPLDFPKRAYNLVYNEWYRDQTQIAELDITSAEDIQKRSWEKDYFTSALPWQQRGTAPALPVSGTSSAVWAGNVTVNLGSSSAISYATGAATYTGSYSGANATLAGTGGASGTVTTTGLVTQANINANTVDLSSATTFDIADLRVAFQLQRWLELNARAGARYTEFLRGHFGVAPRDERLNRPEYLGGSRSPVIVSEVLQTSSTDVTTPQGNMAGHGLAVDRQRCASYFAQEFGCIIGIMSVVPRAAYQQGIDRQWLRQTRYDFYFPEFARLSEQAVEQVELYAMDSSSENKTIFGYQGRYNEMRVKHSQVCSEMRDTFDYWHLGRVFGSAPELNQTFVECVPDKRIFAVEDEDGLIVNVRNVIRAVRPLPALPAPGGIDH